MPGVIRVIGVGPGHRSYASGQALSAIGKTEVLVGSKRLLDEFAGPWHARILVERDLNQLVKDLEELMQTSEVGVLVSGDTGLYSLAAYLEKNMDPDRLEFIPGVSSVQLMFARLKRPWQNARIISLHGREAEDLIDQVMASPVTAILTSPDWTPDRIARLLSEARTPDYRVAIGENLSYPEERVTCCQLSELTSGMHEMNNSVMVIINE